MQLHTADPGAAGTTSVATETTRKTVSFAAAPAASAGVVTILNDAQVQWTGIAGSQDASHYSLWDASSAGNYLGSGLITASAYTAGDTLTFAIGAIGIALNCAA
jgi:FlaG/FlaF family flagellin (archaellin)